MLKGSRKAEKLQISIGKALLAIPLSPNQWTILSLFFAFFGFITLIYREMLFAIPLFAVSLLIDAVDGAIARASGAVTKKGAFLDGVSDRIVEMLMLLGLMLYGLPDVFIQSVIWLALLLFIGSGMTSFVKAYCDHTGAITHEKAVKMGGLFERSERVTLILMAMILTLVNPIYSTYVIIAGVALSSITVVQRIYYVLSTSS